MCLKGSKKARATRLMRQVYEAEMAAEEAQERARAAKQKLLQLLDECGEKGAESADYTCALVERKGSKRVDSAKLQKRYPEAYSHCLKKSAPTRYVTVRRSA